MENRNFSDHIILCELVLVSEVSLHKRNNQEVTSLHIFPHMPDQKFTADKSKIWQN